jgi:DNA-binding phage protein
MLVHGRGSIQHGKDVRTVKTDDDVVTRLEVLNARRAELAQLKAEADMAWVEEIIQQVHDRYRKVDIAARAGISRERLYQILHENGVDLSR